MTPVAAAAVAAPTVELPPELVTYSKVPTVPAQLFLVPSLQMLSMGVPQHAVRHKMTMDGVGAAGVALVAHKPLPYISKEHALQVLNGGQGAPASSTIVNKARAGLGNFINSIRGRTLRAVSRRCRHHLHSPLSVLHR